MESESGFDSVLDGRLEGVDVIFAVKATGEAAITFDVGDASVASNPLGGDSIICAVELKYRTRIGRRKVGGNAEADIRISKTDFLNDLLSILQSWAEAELGLNWH